MNMEIQAEKQARRPVIDPLLLALKSRRVLIAVAALLVGIVVMVFPSLAAVQGELLTLVISLALALIGGISLEDAARAGRDAAPSSDLETLVKAVVVEVVEAVIAARATDEDTAA